MDPGRSKQKRGRRTTALVCERWQARAFFAFATMLGTMHVLTGAGRASVVIVSGMIALAGARLALGARLFEHPWAVYATIIAEQAAIGALVLVGMVHAGPAAAIYSGPTLGFLYLVIAVALRSVSYSGRQVLIAGSCASALWAGFLSVALATGQPTGIEFERLFILLALTGILVASHQLGRRAGSEEAHEQDEWGRNKFLRGASHELKTPMNGIIGMLDIIAREPLPDDTHNSLLMARNSAEQLLTTLTNILDHADTTPPQENAREFVVDELVNQWRVKYTDYSPDVAFHWKERGITPGITVHADKSKLGRIAEILISNAFKFTEHGAVTVEITYEKCAMTLRVTDTGVGIPAEVHPMIFKPFLEESQDLNRKYGGTGIGLAVCQDLAHAIMGDVRLVHSHTRGREQGSCFELTVPLPEVSPLLSTEDSPMRSIRGEEARILIAEDNLVNQRVLLAILRKLGLTADIAENGEQAYERWKESRHNIVLMDIQMPRWDGFQATEAIRRWEADEGHREPRTWVVAVTAHARGDYLSVCQEHGLDDLLEKPVNEIKLADLLRLKIHDLVAPLPKRDAS